MVNKKTADAILAVQSIAAMHRNPGLGTANPATGLATIDPDQGFTTVDILAVAPSSSSNRLARLALA
eukprot:9893135-Heterocapsa_arctica.AAC.1